MQVVEPGHVYKLASFDGGEDEGVILTFVNREEGTEHAGTQTQEVLRALIERTQHCDACLRWEKNDDIVYHLRMALVLHESRALERQVEKGLLKPEIEPVGANGHFLLTYNKPSLELK
jgi:hypothetical protein